MTDVLETDAPLRGLLPVYLGYSHLSDNHNNGLVGRNLTCAGGKPQRVGIMDFAWLVNSIGDVAFAALPAVESKITYNGMKSPLEIECHSLAIAKPNHTPGGKTRQH
jgi:hypothetical protein